MKARFNLQVAMWSLASALTAGLTPVSIPKPPASLSLVLDVAPVLPFSPPSPQQERNLFQFSVVSMMREMSDIEKCLLDTQLPDENNFHPYARLVCTIPPPRYMEEPVYKPPWWELVIRNKVPFRFLFL